MKDLFKNPVFYYVLIPVVAAVWPLLVWARYLPAAQKDLAKWKGWVPDVNAVAAEILRMEPDRLIEGAPQVTEQFDYTTAISRAATKSGIPSGSFPHTTGTTARSSKGQKTQTATVTLKAVGIVQACKFLSTIQLDWPHLECTSIKLVQDKGTVDRWTATLGLEYFYN